MGLHSVNYALSFWWNWRGITDESEKRRDRNRSYCILKLIILGVSVISVDNALDHFKDTEPFG